MTKLITTSVIILTKLIKYIKIIRYMFIIYTFKIIKLKNDNNYDISAKENFFIFLLAF